MTKCDEYFSTKKCARNLNNLTIVVAEQFDLQDTWFLTRNQFQLWPGQQKIRVSSPFK